MLISSETGAGQIVSSHEDTRFYDDIGCLAAEWAARPEGSVAFVHVGSGWSDVERVSFARHASARTPMGSGFVAFDSPSDARAADREGRALAWDEVVKLAGERR
jgi:hypothetical protein